MNVSSTKVLILFPASCTIFSASIPANILSPTVCSRLLARFTLTSSWLFRKLFAATSVMWLASSLRLDRWLKFAKSVWRTVLSRLLWKSSTSNSVLCQSFKKSSESKAFPSRPSSTTRYMSSARLTCVALHRDMVTLRTRPNCPPIVWKSKLEIVTVFAQSTTMAHRRSFSLFVFISALSEVQSVGWRQCSHFLQGKSSSLKSVSSVQDCSVATVEARCQHNATRKQVVCP